MCASANLEKAYNETQQNSNNSERYLTKFRQSAAHFLIFCPRTVQLVTSSFGIAIQLAVISSHLVAPEESEVDIAEISPLESEVGAVGMNGAVPAPPLQSEDDV